MNQINLRSSAEINKSKFEINARNVTSYRNAKCWHGDAAQLFKIEMELS